MNKINIILKTGAFAVLMVLLVQACKHYPGDIPIPFNYDDYTDIPCDPDSVYFVNEIFPLISSTCVAPECHDATSHKEDIVLDSYDNIMKIVRAGRPDNSDLYEVITKTDPADVMPPPPAQLTPEQIDKIRKWIEQGAKLNGCDDCDTTSVTYSTQIVKILTTNCTSCHNTTTSNGGVTLDSYAGVKAQADNGKLYGCASHSSGYKVMPPSGVRISECNITAIKLWIDEGAQNN